LTYQQEHYVRKTICAHRSQHENIKNIKNIQYIYIYIYQKYHDIFDIFENVAVSLKKTIRLAVSDEESMLQLANSQTWKLKWKDGNGNTRIVVLLEMPITTASAKQRFSSLKWL